VSNVFGITARAFRFYEDGSETGSTAIAAESTNITRSVVAGNSALQLRYGVQESGAGSASGATTDDYQVQYAKNGGAYTSVGAATTNVRAFPSANLTDAAATTQRLSAGSGSFVAGEIDEADGIVTDWQLTANNFSELLYSLELVSADLAHNDTLDFRVLRNGAVFNTYSVTPRITVSKFTQNLDNAFEQLCVQLGAVFGVAFDEASGNPTDFIAGKIGTAIGSLSYGQSPGAVQGKTGIDFPTVNDYVTFADHADLDLGDSPFTIVVFLRFDEDLAANQVLLNKGTNGYVMAILDNTTFAAGRGGVAIIVRTTAGLSVSSEWRMLAWTRAGTGLANNVLYVDAVADTTGADAPDDPLSDTTALLEIGREGAFGRVGGALAYLVMFKSVLTQNQIQALHNAALRGPLRLDQVPQLLAQ